MLAGSLILSTLLAAADPAAVPPHLHLQGAAGAWPAELLAGPGERIHVVAFRGPSRSAWRARLEALGAELLGFVPDHAHLVRLEPRLAAALATEDFVRSVTPYHPGLRLDPELSRFLACREGDAPRRLVLRAFLPGDVSSLAAAIEAAGGAILERTRLSRRIVAELAPSQLAELLRSDFLQRAEPWSRYSPDMDNVREESGAIFVETVAGYAGTGVSGEVMDAGVQFTQQDFDGIREHGLPQFFEDPHGTNVYGVLFGNGDRDGDGLRRGTGMLPAAQGWFATYEQPFDPFLHTQELVSAPIFASLWSRSFGTTPTRSYNSASAEMDELVQRYDLAIFQSQSNTGTGFSRPEAWAKNVFSVGGIRHQDTLDRSDDCWCGDASIGPAADGRVKPDLVFWNDYTYCADAEPGGNVTGWYYSDFGGTSAATPMVAGVGGLVLEMWADDVLGNAPQGGTVFEKKPHTATLKALLVNGAEPYPFAGLDQEFARAHQGWGRPSARRFLERAPYTKVIDESSTLADGERDVYSALVTAASGELRVTLAHTDPPGTPGATIHRVNDLSLKVTAPDGSIFWGNAGLVEGLVSLAGGAPDDRNTVENVFVPAPAAGAWRIEVVADEIAEDGHLETPAADQDYGLVVSGVERLASCAGPPAPPPGVSAAAAGDNAIRVAWSGTGDFNVYRAAGACGAPREWIARVAAPPAELLDSPVSGVAPYSYTVRSVSGDCESDDSACAEARTGGTCDRPAVFAGLGEAAGRGSSTCGIRLRWSPALPACGGTVVYNVYRSTNPAFVPSPATRVAACLERLEHLDGSGLAAGVDYWYIVRAEERASAPGGICGGLEEANVVARSATPMTVYRTAFEDGLAGWVASPGLPPASAGGFIVADPQRTSSGVQIAQFGSDHTLAGVNCLFTANNFSRRADEGDVDEGEVLAVSPAIDASAAAGLDLVYWRWHFNRDLNEDLDDRFTVEVSPDDGRTWVEVERLGMDVRANRWTEARFALGPLVALTARMRLRVRSSDGAGLENVIESAIDDVELVAPGTCSAALAAPGVISGPGPLYAVKAAGTARLSWAADCGTSDRFGVYQGDLAAGPGSLAPVSGQCDLTARTVDLPLAGPSAFYLIAPNDGASEGSLGIVDRGLPRPQPAAACYPRAAPVAGCAQ